MKILNLQQFRALPPNVLFSKYQPCCFGDLLIKGDTIPNDFYTTKDLNCAIACSGSDELMDLLERAERDSTFDLSMDFETEGRDGMYEDAQMFAVWEHADVAALIDRLHHCLPDDCDPNESDPAVLRAHLSQCRATLALQSLQLEKLNSPHWTRTPAERSDPNEDAREGARDYAK